MALLGNLDHVKQMLRPVEGWATGADVDARLERIQGAVSAALEEKCGRTWGTDGVDTSRLVWVGAGDTLLLDPPARSISSITVGGEVVGNTMTGGEVVLASSLVNTIVDEDGWILGVGVQPSVIGYGGWWGFGHWSQNTAPSFPVLVTGQFSASSITVPDDVAYAADYLIAETFKRENAGPAGFQGPDGATIPIRNPWKDPLVVSVLEKYQAPRLVAF